jgi:hypothetical protein
MASSWRVLLDTEPVITWAWRQCIPSKLHEPLAQEYGVTSQKVVILNYPVGTPHIITILPQTALSLPLSFSVPRTEPGSRCFASQHLSLSVLITPLPSLPHKMTCTKGSDERLWRATESDLETCSSKAAMGTTPTTLPVANSRPGRTAGSQNKKGQLPSCIQLDPA